MFREPWLEETRERYAKLSFRSHLFQSIISTVTNNYGSRHISFLPSRMSLLLPELTCGEIRRQHEHYPTEVDQNGLVHP